MLTKLVGDRGLSVVAATKTDRVHGEPIEDFISALIRTDDGIVVTLATGYTFSAPKPGDTDVHVGAKGAYLIQRREALTITPAEGAPETIRTPEGFNLYREIFFDALRRMRAGAPPIATVRDCARANDLIDAIYTAASV
jgi:predicted dehydrogenase